MAALLFAPFSAICASGWSANVGCEDGEVIVAAAGVVAGVARAGRAESSKAPRPAGPGSAADSPAVAVNKVLDEDVAAVLEKAVGEVLEDAVDEVVPQSARPGRTRQSPL